MTGKELIIYILENNLENTEIFKDGKFIGLMTEEEAAEKFEVGVSTIRVWVKMNLLKDVVIYDKRYIPANAADPRLIMGGGVVCI